MEIIKPLAGETGTDGGACGYVPPPCTCNNGSCLNYSPCNVH